MRVSFWDWLTASTDDLVTRGVPRRDVAVLRQKTTGHVRPLSPQWSVAFGSWGGVRTLVEIAELVGMDPGVVRNHAKKCGLKFATRKRCFTQAQLGIALWCARTEPPEASCRRYGVWRGERATYCAEVQTLLDALDIGIDTVLGWSTARLETEWERLGLRVGPPRGRQWTRDDLAELCAQAEREMAEVTATLSQEQTC